jgi:hypothetical protein
LPFEKQDYEKSLNIYSSLCANKDFNACIGAGWLYATNRINSQEKFQKAAYCYEIACNEGKRREHCKYIEGLRKDMDVSDTMEHLCDNGNASVCYDMWYAYE